jgi:hypothetical protein
MPAEEGQLEVGKGLVTRECIGLEMKASYFGWQEGVCQTQKLHITRSSSYHITIHTPSNQDCNINQQQQYPSLLAQFSSPQGSLKASQNGGFPSGDKGFFQLAAAGDTVPAPSN